MKNKMKIKDLRIGSLIEAKQSSNIFESGFIKVNFKVLERLTFFPNQIESSVFGVKITNDVLLNLGFKEIKCKDGIFGFAKDGFVYVNTNQIRSISFDEEDSILLNKDINFVHQLQDVFEYVTGNELNIEIFFE